ncbi:MAG: hypothetical protein ABEJ31_09190 [Haloarculaceae archaeon]
MTALIERAWPQIATAAVGAWLLAAPPLLGYGGLAGAVHQALGALLACLAYVATWDHLRPLRWATLPIGIATLTAAAFPGLPSAAVLNATIVGLVATTLSLVPGAVAGSYGGGWSALWRGTDDG